jgi:hypothetical protein
MRVLHFLVVLNIFLLLILDEEFCDIQKNKNIGGGDALSNHEHSHFKMIVDELDQVIDLHSCSLLHERSNLDSFLRALLAEQYLIKISGFSYFHHNCNRV